MTRYRHDPVGYAREVLHIQWWARQVEIAEALLRPPHRVLVKAGHAVGKTHVAAGLVNWWYDANEDGVVLTTAPTCRHVRDVLWKESRRQRGRRGGFTGPKVPRLQDQPDHFALGFTATSAAAFQGLHERAVFIVLDEAVAIDADIWQAVDSMAMGDRFGILALCNPTDTASEFYRREQQGGWHVIHVSALDHPNIERERRGLAPHFPAAARLAWLEQRLEEWCTPVAGAPQAGDIEWPPRSGRYLHPGPLAEARLLGRWPSASAGVWPEALWLAAEALMLDPSPEEAPEIGCDVARFGDDSTAFHVRRGAVSLYHESVNGWSTTQTAGRLKELAREYAAAVNRQRPRGTAALVPQQIAIKIDDAGVGGGVVDQSEGYRFIAVNSSARARRDEDYPNRRSELWFDVAERARQGQLSLARLPAEIRLRLKTQALAPTWKLDALGRRTVEAKERTKSRLGRSPDDMDALNLAFAVTPGGDGAYWADPPADGRTMGARIGLWGR
jgi:hypothetical protein